MDLSDLAFEPSRELTEEHREAVARLPVKISGTNLALMAELGFFNNQLYIRPFMGMIKKVRVKKGPRIIAKDNTFCLLEYRGYKMRIDYYPQTDRDVPNSPYPSQNI
ncbi:MAG TPA: hypothetical protein VJG30_00270 [Candidatus Nanoarchaeia archaeon]|nr:hypothetical protein [Candidatus Nanoarchaeia archaeon]